ncbi:MAG: NAD-dependent deacylase [Candidatus Marinimicrobia bacterium]|nr:NAD-dependent deacylase [Candidatus Neomarinimicrobiota bacterium]MCF7840292.1 NAD-dependent deacylase [Candidatus Neomarinimicrobiota bacterium]MCF7903477.1 NAD-dependent deacylase [Candidatus Neomarinimicrobiota bacterium]
MLSETEIKRAAVLIKESPYTVAFTGAGISVESGIPPFRGGDGLWNKFDPSFLEIDYFYQQPLKSWELIRKIFYQYLGKARPNKAHDVLARMEARKLIHALITQNIDNLHQQAGNQDVIEFHGTTGRLICTACHQTINDTAQITKLIENLPPACPECGGLLKPDFVFFSEMIPESARERSFTAAQKATVFMIIGTSGDVFPAAMLPPRSKQTGATIIEINTAPTSYTDATTDIFLEGKASVVMEAIEKALE